MPTNFSNIPIKSYTSSINLLQQITQISHNNHNNNNNNVPVPAHLLFSSFSTKTHFYSLFSRRNCSKSSIMENNKSNFVIKDVTLLHNDDKYCNEMDVAVKAVQMACDLCQRVQFGLTSKANSFLHFKDDQSLVTIADWSVQATISWILSESLGSTNVSIVAEEDIETLSKHESTDLLERVVETVNECLAEAPNFGVRLPRLPLGKKQVLEAINRCNSSGGGRGKFWVLDPVDGTLGFVRGDQYAIALALVDDGEVVLGVLGCPNYPLRKEWLSYHHRYYRIISKLTPSTSESWYKGFVLYARKGMGQAWMQPLLQRSKKLVWPNSARPINVSRVEDPALATFCEPVERANSSHSFTAGLAHSVGVRCSEAGWSQGGLARAVAPLDYEKIVNFS
ncbi:hypothetical protein RND81_10G031600 [Saponaria officinalis]|uniref:3'(2'),5'-bisphosphate nucleotidase n=1 Tax=Saponaria officinalis TaxID=3572 RepID=A0AAW1HY12_SAPOF